MFQGSADERFRGDDGSADRAVAAALSAFAAGEGSEHAALTALAAARLLVPLVAALAAGDSGAIPAGAGGEKASEMAMPTLTGLDGRPAIPAFTSLDAMARWQPSARPVPADAAQVWRGAAQESCAVVIDVAGPVPLAVEGARLAALAAGAPVPLPDEDHDVRDTVTAVLADLALVESALAESALAESALSEPALAESALAESALSEPAGVTVTLRPGEPGTDLLMELVLPAGLSDQAAQQLVTQIGSAVLERLGSRLRQGIAIAVSR